MNGLKIPFTGLKKQYNNLRTEILDVTDEVLRSGQLMAGNYTAEFENWLARKNHSKYAVTCHSGSQALENFYQQSLQNANTAAQQSALYKQQMNLANRAAGMALSAPGVGLGGVAKVAQSTQDAYGRALGQAEQQRERRFGVLGQASQMKSAEDVRRFDINQMRPFEAKYNLLAARAGQAARQQESGLRNLTQGLTYAGGLFGKGNKSNTGKKSDSGFTTVVPSDTEVYEEPNYDTGINERTTRRREFSQTV